MIKEVNVKEVDNSSFLYPSRSIEIKTDKESILTPTRSATAKEYEDKARVPSDIPINNQITVMIDILYASKFHDLMNIGKYYPKISNKIELNSRLAQYSDLFLTLLIPTKSPKVDKNTNRIIADSPETILENENQREKFLRLIIQLQRNNGLNTISIPYINFPFESFKNVTSRISRELETLDLQPIFFLDFEYEHFDSAINWIADELQSKMIGLYHRSYVRNSLKYDFLSTQYSTRDVAFLTVQVDRNDQNHEDISTMHYLPFFGNDIYAVKTQLPFGGSEKEREKEKGTRNKNPLDSIRLFDRESLCLNKIQSDKTHIENLEEEYRRDTIVKEILDNYYEANTNSKKLDVLRAFTKVDELKRSSEEFSTLQKYVKQNSSKDYIQEKMALQRTLQGIKKISLNNYHH